MHIGSAPHSCCGYHILSVVYGYKFAGTLMIFMVLLIVCSRLCSSVATTTGGLHSATRTLNSSIASLVWNDRLYFFGVLSQLHTAVDN